MIQTRVHGELQQWILAEKHQKQSQLIRYWKYWIHYIQQKKYKLNLIKCSVKFRGANTRQTMQEVFSALRFNKELIKV